MYFNRHVMNILRILTWLQRRHNLKLNHCNNILNYHYESQI